MINYAGATDFNALAHIVAVTKGRDRLEMVRLAVERRQTLARGTPQRPGWT